MIDARGLGKTTAPMHWNHTIEHLAGDVMTVMSYLKIRRFHIFGLSLGGMIAMSVAAQKPGAIKSLVVANSSTADYIGLRLNLGAVRSLALGLIQGHFYDQLMRLVVAPASVRSRGPDILQQWEAIMEEEGFPVPTIAKQLFASARFRIRGQITAKEVPTLVLYGTLDKFVPQRNSRQIQKLIPGSKIKAIKGAGHEITIGHEDEVTRVVHAFVQAL
jgi:pimeloyl-ACP methyl ester carboxylesterase